MDKKIFLITTDNDFFKGQKDFFQIYKKNSILSRIIRKIILKTNFIDLAVLFNKSWINKIKNVDTVVIFDTASAHNVAKNIHEKFPNKRIIIWFWNPVDQTISPNSFDRSFEELWTFDPLDSRKYNLKLNTQFYFSNLPEKNLNNSIKQDIFFVGADKGRKKILMQLILKFKSLHLTYFIRLVNYQNQKFKKSDELQYGEPLTYSQILQYIKNSKGILDLKNKKNQQGLSLRPMESLFLKKKLITNNETIRNTIFYDKSNVFILNENNLSDLPRFLNQRYNTADWKYKTNYYEFQSWCKRFDKNEENKT